MAATDQAPESIKVRDRAGGRPVAGVALGAIPGTADFIQWIQDAQLQVRFGYDAAEGNRLQFVGIGKPGATAAEAAWIIKQFFYVAAGKSADLDRIGYPESGTPGVGEADFVHVWNDRATLTYPG
jgi:hypothetical protein